MNEASKEIMFGEGGSVDFFGDSSTGRGGVRGGMPASDKSGPAGQGLEQMDQGWVTFTGSFDRKRAAAHIRDASQGQAVYGSTTEE